MFLPVLTMQHRGAPVKQHNPEISQNYLNIYSRGIINEGIFHLVY